MRIQALNEELEQWCSGRMWQGRLVLVAWFAYMFFQYTRDPDYSGLLGALNLGIHELGHLVFGFCGEFLGVLGGTLLQCLAPVFGAVNFYRQGDFFGIAFSFAWLASNLFDVARYMGDARAMSLPLVSPFGAGVIHDWNYLLTRMGLLRYDTMLASLVRCLAVVFMLAGIIFGGWLVWKMIRHD